MDNFIFEIVNSRKKLKTKLQLIADKPTINSFKILEMPIFIQRAYNESIIKKKVYSRLLN